MKNKWYEKREHGIDILDNENNLNPISKRKCYKNEKTVAALLFVYTFCYKYDEEEKETNSFNKLHGKNFSTEW